jgi:pyruvate,water dikinase
MLAILEEVSRHVVPLNLTDRRAPEFRAANCRTFHDIARFIHEKAFEEMFRISDQVVATEYQTLRLKEKLPFEVYLIDLGGGLEPHPSGASVLPSQIRSEPMRALLKGMTHPGLRWWEPRSISLGGFMSVATESMFTPAQEPDERRIGDKSYAVVADAYCNFSSRIGYHFTAVDAYVSDSLSRNYVSFRFKGGAADEGRRAKRCELIGEILRRLDFGIERHGDLINGRMRKFDRETLLDRLDVLGKVIVATRQLDMRMGPGTSLEWYADAFFAGNFLFEPESGGRGAGKPGQA